MVHGIIVGIVEEGILIVEGVGVVDFKSVVMIEGIVIHGYITFLGGLCSNVFLIFHHFLVILNINILFIGHYINICFGLHDIQKVFCMICFRLGGYELAIKGWNALPDVIECLVVWEYMSDVL